MFGSWKYSLSGTITVVLTADGVPGDLPPAQGIERIGPEYFNQVRLSQVRLGLKKQVLSTKYLFLQITIPQTNFTLRTYYRSNLHNTLILMKMFYLKCTTCIITIVLYPFHGKSHSSKRNFAPFMKFFLIMAVFHRAQKTFWSHSSNFATAAVLSAVRIWL